MSWICLDEVFPLWSLTSPKIGGLGFNSSNIGVSVAIGGLSLILFQLLLFARLTIRFGPLKLYRFGNLLGAFLMISYPFANLFAESLVGVWIAVALINIGRAVIGKKSVHFVTHNYFPWALPNIYYSYQYFHYVTFLGVT